VRKRKGEKEREKEKEHHNIGKYKFILAPVSSLGEGGILTN